jgi:hypothetical protein
MHWQTGQLHHSVIDMVFSTMELEPHMTACRLDDPAHATSSDHEAIWWTVDTGTQTADPQLITRGWAVGEWLDDADSGRVAEQEWHLRCSGRPILNDACDATTAQDEAEWLRQQLTEMLDWHARKIMVMVRSKRWWGPDIKAAQQYHGRMRWLSRRGPNPPR